MEMKVTPYSNLKILAHQDKLNAIKNGERTAPLYIRIKPTNVCNHKCYYCSYADSELGLRDDVQPNDSIEWNKMSEIINDLGDIGVKAVTFSGGGEPLVYPSIIPAMRLVLQRGIDLSVITNGHCLEGEAAEVLTQAKWVRISMDAAYAESYAEIRGLPTSAFEKICSNIKNFVNIKPQGCEFGINFVIHHKNASQVYDAAKLMSELGVNHIKFAARITKDLDSYHAAFKDKVIEQLHKAADEFVRPGFNIINKYEEDFDTAMVFQRQYNCCYIKEFVTTIAADSKVYFCHDKAYVKNGAVGDLKKMSFKELWFSEAVAERYKKFDAMAECRHHCVYDDRNILLNTFFALDKNHINFI